MRSQFVIALLCLLVVVFGAGVPPDSSAGVVYEGDAIFIVDRTGEKWNITQAVSIGFDPRGFQFGIGRDAIRPLDESSFDDQASRHDPGARIIGVENGPNAHAYVVRKLTRHEIANTRLGEVPIAAAY